MFCIVKFSGIFFPSQSKFVIAHVNIGVKLLCEKRYFAFNSVNNKMLCKFMCMMKRMYFTFSLLLSASAKKLTL